jgi:hypothetical protein
MERPLYSPNLALNGFWLFPKIKFSLNGQRFQDIDDIWRLWLRVLKATPQQELQKCFQQ